MTDAATEALRIAHAAKADMVSGGGSGKQTSLGPESPLTPAGLTAKQLSMRRDGIGASETAALLGLDPYRGPVHVYANKTGTAEAFAGNSHTDRGRYLEPSIRQWASDKIGRQFYAATTMAHKDYPRIMATPDGIDSFAQILADRPVSAVLEIKAPGPRTWHEWGDGDNAPDRYVVQVAQQMLVFGASTGYLAALVGGDLRVYQYVRDPELEATIIDTIETFWTKYIEPLIPPPPDGSPDATELLRHRFPKSSGRFLVADHAAEDAMLVLRGVREEIRRLEQREEVAKQVLMAMIGDADGIGSAALGRVTWKNTKDTERLDIERLRAEQPEIAAKYTVSKPGVRTFRTHFLKGSDNGQP